MTRIYVTTATGGLSTDVAPVGGGVAVLEALLPALAARADYEVTVLRPAASPGEREHDEVRWVDLPVAVLRDAEPDALLHLGERCYARFALQWEAALRRFFEAVDPAGAVVLANDVSEGPPFAWLHGRGFRQLVLYHVVVADFFARQYLAGRYGLRISAARAAQLWRGAERLGLGRLAPEIARLVWAKEGESARCAEALVAPSAPLGEALAACYPELGVEGRTHVVPWGVIGGADPGLRARRGETLAEYEVSDDRFAGYGGGEAKWRLFAAADLFCSLSHYEAYGLTIAQALASGTPVLATGHQGARAMVRTEFGWVVGDGEREIAGGVERAVALDLRPMREAAADWGRGNGFGEAARAVIAIIDGVSG